MIDIQFLRDNPEAVEENAKHKGYHTDIQEIIALDEQTKTLQRKVEEVRRQRNEHASNLGDGKPTEEQIEQGKAIKTKLVELESQLEPLQANLTTKLKAVPNMALSEVPIGASEDDNQVVSEHGDKPQFEFEAKSHAQLGEQHSWIDKERAAKVSGSRFAYIKGELAQLQLALMTWTVSQLTSTEVIEQIVSTSELDEATSRQPFTFMFPPAMLRTEVFEAMDRLEPSDDRYQVGMSEDNLWLQGSAEHTIGPMHMNEIIDAQQLPLRYVGYSSSFRREAGTYGKDTEGIIRMHQFDKLEMESFSTPEQGANEHKFMVAIQTYLVEQLQLPYRILQKCTADIGKPNASGWDIDVWFPSQNQYRETHTADYMTDYQARRLNTRARRESGEVELVHNNDATAFALGRTMAAIIENYQQSDSSVAIPKVLQPIINKEVIGASRD